MKKYIGILFFVLLSSLNTFATLVCSNVTVYPSVRSARLLGYSRFDGTNAVSNLVFYGTTDGGNTAALWDASAPYGSVIINTPINASITVTSLTASTIYKYRFFIQYTNNALGELWATNTSSFMTTAEPTNPPSPHYASVMVDSNGVVVTPTNLFDANNVLTNLDIVLLDLTNLVYSGDLAGSNYTEATALSLTNKVEAGDLAGSNYVESISIGLTNKIEAGDLAGSNYIESIALVLTNKVEAGDLAGSNYVDGMVTDYSNYVDSTYLKGETDPIWVLVSNTVTEGSALGATAVQTETDPGFAAVSNALTIAANNGQTAFGWGFWGTPTSSIIPTTSNTVDLGSSALPFRHGYFGTNSVYLGTNQLTVLDGALRLNGAAVSAAESDPVFLAYKPTLLSRFATDENNILLNAFRIQALANVSYRDMIGAWVDGYIDQTGINTGASVNAYYASRGYKGSVISESQALHVNGLSAYITNSGSLLTWTGDFTLLLWVQADYLADEFLLYGVQNNRLMWGSNHKLELGRPNIGVSESAMSVPDDQEFHLVGMTYNSSTEEVIYYIDGNSAGTANGADIPTPTGVAYIGTPPWEPGQATFGSIGSIYAVGIWDSILSQSTITGLYDSISFDSDSPSHNFVFDGTLDGWAMAAGSETYTNGVSVRAATNLTLVSTNYPAASIPTEMDVMIIAATNGAPTINTQIVVQVTANNGTNYQDVTLSDAGLFDSTKRFYTGTITNITNPGNRLGYRIETTNAVDVSFYGASILYR